MQGIHSLCEARRERKREKEGGDEEGGGKERERERRMNETKLFGSTGFYLFLHISDIPPHSLGWS